MVWNEWAWKELKEKIGSTLTLEIAEFMLDQEYVSGKVLVLADSFEDWAEIYRKSEYRSHIEALAFTYMKDYAKTEEQLEEVKRCEPFIGNAKKDELLDEMEAAEKVETLKEIFEKKLPLFPELRRLAIVGLIKLLAEAK